MMQKVRFAYLLFIIALTSFTNSYAKERIPFVRQSIQGTWVITKFESTSIVNGEQKTQDTQESKNVYSKLTFLRNDRFIADDMRITFPDGKVKTYSFSGQFLLDDSTGIMRLSFDDPTDKQPLQLFFKIEISEEGLELLVNKEELFMSMDFVASKDTFTATLNEVFKASIESYSSHYHLKKSYQ
ncbi:MAG: hypothetical protein ACK4UP_04015 [Spirosomataceae bacterium]